MEGTLRFAHPTALITPRRGNRVQPIVAEHMRHEAWRAEDFGERRIADAEAAGVGAERRHHRALAIAGEASPLHRTAAGGDARLGMQMTCNFTNLTGRF